MNIVNLNENLESKTYTQGDCFYMKTSNEVYMLIQTITLEEEQIKYSLINLRVGSYLTETKNLVDINEWIAEESELVPLGEVVIDINIKK